MTQYMTRQDSDAVRDLIGNFLDATKYGRGSTEHLDEMMRQALRFNLKPHDHAIVLSHAADGAVNKYAYGEPEAAKAVIDKYLPEWMAKATRFPYVPPHFIPATLHAMALLRRGPSDEFLSYAEKTARPQIHKFNEREIKDLYGAMAELAVTFSPPFMDAVAARTPAAIKDLSGDHLFHLLYDMATIDAVDSVGMAGHKSAFRNVFMKIIEDPRILAKLEAAHSQENLRMVRDATSWFTGRKIRYHSPGKEFSSNLETEVAEALHLAGGSIMTPVRVPDTGHQIDIAVSFNTKVGLIECDGEPYHFNRWPGRL